MLAPIPFIYLCDPTPEASFENLVRLVNDGAKAIIAGVPFSDPCADGETLEIACGRAFKCAPNQATSFELIRRFKEIYPDVAVYVRAYTNQVYAPGIENFVRTIKTLGADGLLVLDLPVAMVKLMPVWKQACDACDLPLVQSLPMNASDDTVQAAIDLPSKIVLFEYQSHCPVERLTQSYQKVRAAGIKTVFIGSNPIDVETLALFKSLDFDGLVIETAVAAMQNAAPDHMLPERPLSSLLKE
jgi:tryptophan synthase alpha subunit